MDEVNTHLERCLTFVKEQTRPFTTADVAVGAGLEVNQAAARMSDLLRMEYVRRIDDGVGRAVWASLANVVKFEDAEVRKIKADAIRRGPYGLRDGMKKRALDFVLSQPKAVTTGEIRQALGLTSSGQLSARLGELYNDGLIDRLDRGVGRGIYAFWINPATRKGAKMATKKKAVRAAKKQSIPALVLKALARRKNGATTDELAKLTASAGPSVSSACGRLVKSGEIVRVDGSDGRGTEARWALA